MGQQLDLFAPKPKPKAKRSRKGKAERMETEDECSARTVREEMAAITCRLHAPRLVCPDCPGVTATDGYGFPHSSECRGLTPVRICPHCLFPYARGSWSPKHAACTFDGCVERRKPCSE